MRRTCVSLQLDSVTRVTDQPRVDGTNDLRNRSLQSCSGRRRGTLHRESPEKPMIEHDYLVYPLHKVRISFRTRCGITTLAFPRVTFRVSFSRYAWAVSMAVLPSALVAYDASSCYTNDLFNAAERAIPIRQLLDQYTDYIVDSATHTRAQRVVESGSAKKFPTWAP